MTYREWITQTVAKFQIGPDDVELILTNQSGLISDPEAEVNVSTAKRALCLEFGTLIPLANISEGGYSISWNWDALKLWYNLACAEVGLVPVGKPTIKDRSNRW